MTALEIRWSVSRGRETYGYNICTLEDHDTHKRYRCNGGGYDMLGTVFAEWLQDTHYPALLELAPRAHGGYILDGETHTRRPNYEAPDSLYGLTWTLRVRRGGSSVALDGACGLESIERIARAIGLKVSRIMNRRGNVTMFIVEAS